MEHIVPITVCLLVFVWGYWLGTFKHKPPKPLTDYQRNKCSWCKGKGYRFRGIPGYHPLSLNCPHCGGTGKKKKTEPEPKSPQ